MALNEQDQDIRNEVRATLKANRAASLDTVLGNWRYHRHGTLEETEAKRVETVLAEERAEMIKRELTGEHERWWRFW